MTEIPRVQTRRSTRVAGNAPMGVGPLGRFTTAGRSIPSAGVRSIARPEAEKQERPVAAHHRIPDGSEK